MIKNFATKVRNEQSVVFYKNSMYCKKVTENGEDKIYKGFFHKRKFLSNSFEVFKKLKTSKKALVF